MRKKIDLEFYKKIFDLELNQKIKCEMKWNDWIWNEIKKNWLWILLKKYDSKWCK